MVHTAFSNSAVKGNKITEPEIQQTKMGEMEKLALCKPYTVLLAACTVYSSAITESPVNNGIFKINSRQKKPSFLH